MSRFLAAVSVAVCAPLAGAVIVQGTELPALTPVTNQLGMSHGVVFSSLNSPDVVFTQLFPGIMGIQGTEPWAPATNGGWYSSPIFVKFVSLSDGVTPATVSGTITAMWGDGGGDTDAVDMRAFDLNNNLVAAQTFTGSTFTQIQLSGVGIHRLEFWANTNIGAGTSDTGLDWLDYPTPQVPAPASAAALLGLLALRRRRMCVRPLPIV